jgi:glycosyltransferase involved in cell wall biosynthesis
MIYVLVPAWNEAPTVGLLLWKVRQLFTGLNREYQLIVVNDGSTDSSDDVLAPYERTLPLTLVSHRKRQGYARTLEELLRLAVRRTDRPRRDVAVTIQADFSDAVDEIPELLKRVDSGADIAVADRRRSSSGGAATLARRALALCARVAVRVPGADDVVGTLRAYRLSTIQYLVREAGEGAFLTREGWAADLELLVRAARHARRVDSVPLNGSRLEGARPARRRHVADAWRALRAAFALRALPQPAPQTAPPPDRPPSGEPEPRQGGRRRGRGGRRGGRGRRGRGEGPGRSISSPAA